MSEKDMREPSPMDTQVTMMGLDSVPDETLATLAELSIPEVQKLKQEIGTVLPAGNLPGMILTGLTTLKERRISRQQVNEDLNALFNSGDILPQALYSIVFGGPAVVLSAYQRILSLAGKDSDAAFPEGTWQFYLQFGLREDTGRHTYETISYQRDRPEEATEVDHITAWIMTAIDALFDTDALNGSIWSEWTELRLLKAAAEEAGIANQHPFSTMLREWQELRPYQTPAGVSYAAERHAAFERFAAGLYARLSDEDLLRISQTVQELAHTERPAYQRQMSLLARLQPGRYRDERIPVPLWDAKIGLVCNGNTYLFHACTISRTGLPLAETPQGDRWPLIFNPDGYPLDRNGTPLTLNGSWLYRPRSEESMEPVARLVPADARQIKALVQQIIDSNTAESDSFVDLQLLQVPRADQEQIRKTLPAATQRAIEDLGHAPIIINWDEQAGKQPLGSMRRKARRGIGDHAMTIMRTQNSIVFDLSHIFFDGIWGMAISEVMTTQAVSWCRHVKDLSLDQLTAPVDAVEPVKLIRSSDFLKVVRNYELEPHNIEVDAETQGVDLALLNDAREWLAKRGVKLTINDILLLARILHAANYEIPAAIQKQIQTLSGQLQQQIQETLESASNINPALLIPMDASFISPKERIFPTTFRNAINNLHSSYDEVMGALQEYNVHASDANWLTFYEARRSFMAILNAFGEMLTTIKLIAMQGESFNTATIKMLAHLPSSMQHLLDQIPQRVGMLNEVIKGEEVFSNVGRVARGASLVRFLSAKDDGRSKKLVWGILTDDNGRMTITLRDFRPHVVGLVQAGYDELATQLAMDYVETYAQMINRLGQELHDVASLRGGGLK